MAATLWKSWLSGAAIAGAACAVVLWLLVPVSSPAALAAGAAFAICTPSFFVAASFLVAIASRSSVPSNRDMPYLLRAFLTEIVDFNIAAAGMMVSKPPINGPPGGAVHRPVLLIHGFACNHSVWKAWPGLLEDYGFGPVRLIDLEPPLADVEHHAAHVERELRALFQECGASTVDIIAHSMGGLVARAALRRLGPGIIGQIVTLATPHHGTVLARLFARRGSLRQTCPESPWLKQLNAEQENGLEAPLTSIYSLEDNLVAPALSSTLRHAHLIELRGIGHLGILSSRKAMGHALSALRAGESP